jgi:uncharacterized phage-like protein YoqJ
MKLCFTGHRPNKLPNKQTGYDTTNPIYTFLRQETERLLIELNPDETISGMALGFDWIGAEASIKLGIPFIAAVPFISQARIWPTASQKQYEQLLAKAKKVVIVSEGTYSVEKMQIRNCWMVDHANIVIACFDGTRGGTKNCVDYAIGKNKTMHYIDPTKAPKI